MDNDLIEEDQMATVTVIGTKAKEEAGIRLPHGARVTTISIHWTLIDETYSIGTERALMTQRRRWSSSSTG